jgi:hypothetical protein
MLQSFLNECEPELSKTKTTHIYDGFGFLAQNYCLNDSISFSAT